MPYNRPTCARSSRIVPSPRSSALASFIAPSIPFFKGNPGPSVAGTLASTRSSSGRTILMLGRHFDTLLRVLRRLRVVSVLLEVVMKGNTNVVNKGSRGGQKQSQSRSANAVIHLLICGRLGIHRGKAGTFGSQKLKPARFTYC